MGNIQQQKPTVHLVIKGTSVGLIEKIKEQCIYTGRDETLDSLLLAVREGRGGDPEIYLINAGTFFSILNQDLVKARTEVLIANLRELRLLKPKSRLVVLFPEDKKTDIDLIDGLLKLGIYDFYFLDQVTDEDITTWLYTEKNINDVSAYLDLKNRKDQVVRTTRSSQTNQIDEVWIDPLSEEDSARQKAKIVKTETVYTPYIVNKQIIAFWGTDEPFLSHGLAVLTAKQLASQGFKVALIEPIKNIPNLAETTGFKHKYLNITNALNRYREGDSEFLKKCLINKTQYQDDPNAPEDQFGNVENWPDNLYVLPSINSLEAKEGLSGIWRSFINDLLKDIVFQKGLDFVIIDVTGEDEIAYNTLEHATKVFYISNLHPANLCYAIEQQKQKDNDFHIIASRYVEFIAGELAGELQEPILYPPDNIYNELLRMIYLHDHRFSEESLLFIEKITAKLGVKLNNNPYDKKNNLSFILDKIKNWRQ